ncbi:MAG TPA: hypothetical protein VNO79_07955 [Actinomycetota bacterium]|nr:hypothetical protein [Actinomycetota bacterium]
MTVARERSWPLVCGWCGRRVRTAIESPWWPPPVRVVCVPCFEELDRLDLVAAEGGIRRTGPGELGRWEA